MAGTVLLSFLGTGRIKKDEVDTYQETTYVFPNGREYSTPLATAPLVKEVNPQKVVFIGTSKSMWPGLDELVKYEGIEVDKELHSRVFDETLSDEGICSETLQKWEEHLNEKLPYSLAVRLVKDEHDLESIVRYLCEEVPHGSEKVILEITHAFRHFPLIASFTMPVLRILKDIGDVSFVYGLFGRDKSKIIFLDEVNKLIQLSEALALSDYGGNFSKLSEVLGEEKLRELYLRVETNRRIRPAYLKKILASLEEKSIYTKIAKEYLKDEVFPSLSGEYLSLRMANRAVFFARKGQFLKAYTLIYEAIINCFLNRQEYESAKAFKHKQSIYEEAKEKVEECLKKEKELYEVWKSIRTIRNAIAHGDKLSDEHLSEEKLTELIEKGKGIVETILSGRD